MLEKHEVAPLQLQGRIKAEIYRGGELIDTLYTKNLITNVGLQHALDASFGDTVASATWYCAPLKSGTPAANWTVASLSGNEFTNYVEGARQVWTGVRTNQTITNSASKAGYEVNAASQTISGAFLIDSSTKGGTATGVLFAAGEFASPRSGLESGDQIYLTYEIQSANGS